MNMSTKMPLVRNTDAAPEVFQTFIQKELAWVQQSIVHCKTLLDAGCGDGRIATELSALTDHYTGIDYDQDAIA